MPKKVTPIIINEADIMKLRSIVDGSAPSGESIIKRARVLLLMSEGMQQKDIAAKVNMRENTISDIRKRFLVEGIDCLYDKSKSGRPLSYDPKALEDTVDLRLQQCVADNKPFPSVKEFSEELKAPQHVIRDLLQRKGIISERGPRYWRFTLSNGTVPKLSDMVGLYLTPHEQALVLKVWTPEKDMTIDLDLFSDDVEVVGTKTKEIAVKLQALFDASGKIDMADALNAFQNSGRAIRLGKKDSAVSFLKDILPDGFNNIGVEYHVFTCGVSVLEKKNDLLPDTYLHEFSTQEEWMSQLDIIVSGMYSGTHGIEQALRVRNGIYNYLRMAKSNTEPFQWMKVAKESEESKLTTDKNEPASQENLSDSDPGAVRFTAEFVDDNHNVITVRVHTKLPITQEEFETESRREYLNSYDKIEKAIISASREASRLLSERYLGEIGKKKQLTNG